MPTPIRQKLDSALAEILGRIDNKTITRDDLDGFIRIAMIESSPEAIRNRLRRRMLRGPLQSHIEPATGHQRLKLPKFAARVQPRLEPVNKQSRGRSRMGHRHSARTQAGRSKDHDSLLPPRFRGPMEFIMRNMGRPITEEAIEAVRDKIALRAVATKLLGRSYTANLPSSDCDWLYALIQKLS